MKKTKALFYLSVIGAVAVTILLVVFIVLNYLQETMTLTTFLILLLSVLVYTCLVIVLVRYYNFTRSLYERAKFNKIKFDKDTLFNNRSSFSFQISYVVKHKKKNYAIIAFSLFSLTEKYQYYQLKSINKFYSMVVDYLEIFMRQKDYHAKLIAGFDNDRFLMCYEYADLDELNSFIAKVEKDMYTLYAGAEVNINMHPIFGVYKVIPEVTIVQTMIENAYLALGVASHNLLSLVFYDQSFSRDKSSNQELQKEIENGLKNHEFKVYYQGKFDLNTNKFVGAEALVRWEHPEKGLFNPGIFIGECEKSGLIHMLDFYVFDQVCKDLGDWKKRGRRMIPISTNFSPYDFYRPDFIDSVMKEIEDNNINPLYIELEITESSTANNFFYVMSVLKRLQNMDIRILMDDFGTGYSSFSNIKKYPINALKIDKSFIDDIEDDIKSREIVETIIRLSKSLGLLSIAEGAQTEKQVKILKKLNCDQIQGYYYCKPMTKKEFEVFLSTNEFEKKGR